MIKALNEVHMEGAYHNVITVITVTYDKPIWLT